MISLLCPPGKDPNYIKLSEATQHDLALDQISTRISGLAAEQNLIVRLMSKMTDDPEVTEYRCQVFADILAFPKMREEMMKLLEKVNFLKDYGSFRRDHEKAGLWDLMHRLDEVRDYIRIVESVHKCLTENPVQSRGLLLLKEYATSLYEDAGFEYLKKDIAELNSETSSLRSITLGVNLNDRMETESIGLISVNSKPFTKSNVLSNFTDFLVSREAIRDSSEWNGSMRYQPLTEAEMAGKMSAGVDGMVKMSMMMAHPILAPTLSQTLGDHPGADMPHYLERVMNQMLTGLVKKLQRVLSKHIAISITEMAILIPEFTYYIRWAEYIEKLQEKGIHFCRPQILNLPDAEAGRQPQQESLDSEDRAQKEQKLPTGLQMQARGLYNMKLADSMDYGDIVTNDLDFDRDKQIYILTGANRGGKTTITQAIGMLYLMAQGGIYVPADSFSFAPADCIYTHFPADEDKTMDLGRLGEECRRFREMYENATCTSLMLLNETFSTTSFEEGYYIARDAIRALRIKGIRTIYNTHMHKLGYEVDEMNWLDSLEKEPGGICSLVSVTDEGKRSYKVKLSAPEGSSFAEDIARKYGVTFEQLMKQ